MFTGWRASKLRQGFMFEKKSLRAQHQIAEKPAKNPGTPRRAKGLWAESILYRFPILLPVLQAQHRELPGSSTLKDWSKPTKF